MQELHIYLDFKQDESYTPSRLAVRAGSAYHDLKVKEQDQVVGIHVVSAVAYPSLCARVPSLISTLV